MLITKGAAAKGAAALGATGAGGTGLYYAGDYISGLSKQHKGTSLLNLVRKKQNGHIVFKVQKDSKDLATEEPNKNDLVFSNSSTPFVVSVVSDTLETTEETHSTNSSPDKNIASDLKITCNFEFKIVGDNSSNKTTINDNHKRQP